MNTFHVIGQLVVLYSVLIFRVHTTTPEDADDVSEESVYMGGADDIKPQTWYSFITNKIKGRNGKNPKKRRPSFEEFLDRQGYYLEIHTVVTQDKYILKYHHLLARTTRPTKDRAPILLQHGFLSASGSFMTRKGSSLAFALADHGFDVWMGNARGNMFSRHHETLDPDKDDVYWEFSFHEMGKYDLPAGIDYILKKTNKPTLIYIGFSMGTTMFFVMGATRPEYMSKVELMVAVAPVCRPKHMALAKNPYKFGVIDKLFRLNLFLGFDEMFPRYERPFHYIEILCQPHKTPSRFCIWLLSFLMTGRSPHHDETNSLRRLMYFPAGTSVRTAEHYLQIAKSGIFREYDHGRRGNLWRYHQLTPPVYDLKKVTATMYFIWSNVDRFAAREDVLWLMSELPKVPFSIRTSCGDFSHGDFMHGKNATDLIHNEIIKNIFYAAEHGDDESSLSHTFDSGDNCPT